MELYIVNSGFLCVLRLMVYRLFIIAGAMPSSSVGECFLFIRCVMSCWIMFRLFMISFVFGVGVFRCGCFV